MIEKAASKSKKHLHEHLTWKVLLIISLVLAVGFGLGLAFDYQIADSMYNTTHLTVSTIPHLIYAYLILLFNVLSFSICWTFVISCYAFKHDKIWVPILGTLGGWAIMGGFGFYIYYFMEPFKIYYGEQTAMIHNIVWMIVIFLGSFIFSMFLFSDKFNKDMCKRTFTYLMEVLVVVALLVFLKMLWSRPSPITVFSKQSDPYPYRAWWELKPFTCFQVTSKRTTIEFLASPAGFGTQSAVIIFATTSTLELTKRFEKHKLHAFFFYAAWSYAIILAIARLMAGESYLTDVCLTLISGLWLSFGSKKLAKVARKKFYGHEE